MDGRLYDAVQNHVGEPFHHALVTGWRSHRVFLVFGSRRQEESQQEDAHEEDAEGILGERNVERTHHFAGAVDFDQFARLEIGCHRLDEEIVVGLAVFQFADVFR